MIIKQLTQKLMNSLIIECKKTENKNKIKKNIIDPLIHYTFARLYPYIITTSIIFFLTFILCIIILVLILKINISNVNFTN